MLTLVGAATVAAVFTDARAAVLFDADVANTTAYAAWPESPTLTGGSWQNRTVAEYNSTTPALVLTNETEALGFDLESAVAADSGVFEFAQTAYFMAATQVPEVPAGAKAALCLIDDGVTPAWYGLAKDTTTNSWTKLAEFTTQALDGEGGYTASFTARISCEGGAPKVTYAITGFTLSQSEFDVVIDPEATIAGVSYKGEGEVRASSATFVRFPTESDRVGGGEDGNEPDGIDDVYQKKFTFKVVNGWWNDRDDGEDRVRYATFRKGGEPSTDSDAVGTFAVAMPAAGNKPAKGPYATGGAWWPCTPANDMTVAWNAESTYVFGYNHVGGTDGKRGGETSTYAPSFTSELKLTEFTKDGNTLSGTVSSSILDRYSNSSTPVDPSTLHVRVYGSTSENGPWNVISGEGVAPNAQGEWQLEVTDGSTYFKVQVDGQTVPAPMAPAPAPQPVQGKNNFDAKISTTANYASWPTSATVDGGSWSNAPAAEYDANIPAVVMTNAEEVMSFQLTSSKPADSSVFHVSQTMLFSPFAEVPAVPADAKVSLCLVGNSESVAWYGLVKDPAASTNTWTALTAVTAPALDGDGVLVTSVVVKVTSETGTPVVNYSVGGSALTVGGEADLPIVLPNGSTFSAVAYTGDTDVRASTGYLDEFVASVNGRLYTDINAALAAAGDGILVNVLDKTGYDMTGLPAGWVFYAGDGNTGVIVPGGAWAWFTVTEEPASLPAGVVKIGDRYNLISHGFGGAAFDFRELAGVAVTDGVIHFCEGTISVGCLSVGDVALKFVGDANGTVLKGVGAELPAFLVDSNAAVGWYDLTFTRLNQAMPPECGGAIFAVGSGALTVSNCTFTGCEAFEGGAICTLREAEDQTVSPLLVQDSVFNGNYAGFDGGAICAEGRLEIAEGCVFDGNEAGFTGGAVAITSNNGYGAAAANRECVITGAAFTGNGVANADEAGALGGAVYATDCLAIQINDTVFSNNVVTAASGAFGGALAVDDVGSVAFTNCVIRDSEGITALDVYGANDSAVYLKDTTVLGGTVAKGNVSLCGNVTVSNVLVDASSQIVLAGAITGAVYVVQAEVEADTQFGTADGVAQATAEIAAMTFALEGSDEFIGKYVSDGTKLVWAKFSVPEPQPVPQDPQNATSAVVVVDVDVSWVPETWTKEFAINKVDASGEVIAEGERKSSVNGMEIPLDEGDPTGYYTVVAYCRPDGTPAKSDDEVVIASTNEIGIIKTTPTTAKTILAVPWRELGGEGDVTVSNLVKTATLTKGDKLHVYDQANSCYKTWELDENKNWQPVATYAIDENGQVSSSSSGTPSSTTVARGSGVWLERKDPSRPIYYYGRHDSATPATTEIAAGTTDEPKHYLVAPTGIADFDLNNINYAAGARKGDRVSVPTDGAPKDYTFDGTCWGYNVLDETGKYPVYRRKTDDTTVKAGTGFWYISNGGNPTINW